MGGRKRGGLQVQEREVGLDFQKMEGLNEVHVGMIKNNGLVGQTEFTKMGLLQRTNLFDP